jgi:hypothetical protein
MIKTPINLVLPAWLFPFCLAAASVIGVALISLQVRPGADIVTVVFPPWWTPQQTFGAIAAAQAEPVSATALPSVLVVRPVGDNGLARLRDAGALMALDPLVTTACFKND